MGRPTVRLKDIADKTGFSANTVSLALRQSPRIPEETRAVIQAAAEELNYLPNQIAKSLVSRETKTIGLVLTQMTNPVLTMTAQAIEQALAEEGYVTMFATSNNTLEDEKRVVEMFRARQVDGMLIYPRSHQRLDHVRKLRQSGYPVVVMVGKPDGIDSVAVDDYSGARKAVEHLVTLGHKRIGILDGQNPRGNLEKSQGYRDALKAHRIKIDDSLMIDPKLPGTDAGYRAMGELMRAKQRPTAVFCSTDSTAIGAEKWCLEHGIRVPDEVAIVGFDNVEFAAYAAVPITSINYDVANVTRMAVGRLMELIRADHHLPEPQHTLIDPDLVVRASTGGA
ncbi:MAG: LacI family DNA-binding transcriptional regulator [Hyphomicrobiaceae bacterium]|nr:LacI family DNA-binding transcriptional regulator [Hyphomicrobiaceae bacterium]